MMLSNGTMRGGNWRYGSRSDPLTWGERLLRWAVTLILLAALGLCWFYLLGGTASAQQPPAG